MTKILLIAITVLCVALGLALWRVDSLSGQNDLLRANLVTVTETANKNADEVNRLVRQRSNDAAVIGKLQRRYEDLHTSNLNLRELLRHEEDGPTAPVLKCAVDERLCKSNSGAAGGNGSSNTAP